MLTLNVPAGSYTIVAKASAYNATGAAVVAQCVLGPSDGFMDNSGETVAGGADVGFGSLSNAATDTFSGASTITYSCNVPAVGDVRVYFDQMRIVATKVGTIH
jgi:hypothetical protein